MHSMWFLCNGLLTWNTKHMLTLNWRVYLLTILSGILCSFFRIFYNKNSLPQKQKNILAFLLILEGFSILALSAVNSNCKKWIFYAPFANIHLQISQTKSIKFHSFSFEWHKFLIDLLIMIIQVWEISNQML